MCRPAEIAASHHSEEAQLAAISRPTCPTTVAILSHQLKLRLGHGRSSLTLGSGSSLMFLINEREAEARHTSAQWYPQ
jgi:hypothetical protein